jgi:Serine carboxypeptidase S28
LTPGECNADGFEGYLTNKTINGQIAQQQKGATIVLEHRFYGQSNPYNDLSVQSLQVHTIQQAIGDLVYFAENVKLAMPGGDNVTPDVAPWILIGGSYAGALTAWTMAK